MEVGKTFFLTLACGLIGLVLIMTGTFMPGQLTFESRPYARAIMLSGKMDGMTAAQLGLSDNQLELVKSNYQEFLKTNTDTDDSDSSDSSESGENRDYSGLY